MPDFETGIASYIWGVAVVRVPFPVDYKGRADISCNQCRYFRRSSISCALNGAVVQYPDKYVGGECPLEREEENETDPASASQ